MDWIRSKITGLCLTSLMGIALLLLILLVWGHSPAPTEAAHLSAGLSTTPDVYPPSYYGTLYLYVGNSPGLWGEDYRDDMRAVLQQASAFSLTTVVQGFPNALADEGREEDWLIFLDEAEAAGIDVIGQLVLGGDNEDSCLYNPDTCQFNCDDLKHFLDEVGDHPAMIGYVALHEGLQRFDSDQFQALYAEMKAYAPDLLLTNYMSDIYWFEQHPELYPNRDFRNGICDICLLWYFPFRYIDGEPVFETTQVENLIENNLPLIRGRDPDAQFWFLAQVFAYDAHPRQLRMPTQDEMTGIYQLVMQYPIDGFLWYTWQHGTYDVCLGDPGMEEQQDHLESITESFLRKADLTIQQGFLADATEISPNDILTYTLTFTNSGPETASNVVIEDIMSSVFEEPIVVGSSGVMITRTPGVTFSWNIGALGVDQGGTITLAARVSPTLQTRVCVTNVAVISATTIDENLTNNHASINSVVSREADLTIQQKLRADVTEFLPKELLTYALTFANNGPDKASAVVIEYSMPDVLEEPMVVENSGVAITQTPGMPFSWDVGALEVGQGGTITLTARVSPSLQTRIAITNVASVSSTTLDTQLANNCSHINLVVGYHILYLPIVFKNE